MDGIWQPCGSVNARNRDNCAYLGVWNDGPKLNWNWDDNANPIYGSASRGKYLEKNAPEHLERFR